MPRDPSCNRCALHTTAGTRCIAGRVLPVGSVLAGVNLMIVGENPGGLEDRQGQVFVGPSGELLERGMADAGLPSAFLTNATRCFKDGQTVRMAHIRACRPYLDEEITALRPTHVLLLGNAALQSFGFTGGVTEQAGKIVERDGVFYMAAFHPAAILRDLSRYPAWVADLQGFARQMRGETLTAPPVQVIVLPGTPLRMQLPRNPVFSIDFEAKPRAEHWRRDKPVPWWHDEFVPYSVAFGTPDLAMATPLLHPESLTTIDEVTRFCESLGPEMRVTAHNWLYDGPVWYRCSGQLPTCVVDTQPLSQLLDENVPHRLKWLGRTMLGWPDWDIDASVEHPLAKLLTYNGYDAAATAALAQRMCTELTQDEKLTRYFERIVMPAVNAIALMMTRGVYIDAGELTRRRAENGRLREEAARRIPVKNPGSSQQIAAWLYDDLQLPILGRTESGAPSTAEETLTQLAVLRPGIPALLDILDYRRYAKYESTYFKDMSERLQRTVTGRVHYEYSYGTVETGRLSSAFHTIPRDPFVRSVVSAPPGRVLIHGDYSQLEARIIAWVAAGEPGTWEASDPDRARMLWAFRAGLDIYKLQAAEALGKRAADITKDERQMLGKVPTLAFLYGMRPNTYVAYVWSEYRMVVSEEEATRLRRAFFTLWPEVERWHRIEERRIRLRGYVRSPVGRIRRLPQALGDGAPAVEAVKAGINFHGQWASDITQRAHALLNAMLPPSAFVVGNIHDALLVECDERDTDAVAGQLLDALVRAPETMTDVGLSLPSGLLRAEITVGPWGVGTPWEPKNPH